MAHLVQSPNCSIVAAAKAAFEDGDFAQLVKVINKGATQKAQEVVASGLPSNLPPGAKVDQQTGEVYREVPVPHPGSEPTTQRRPVCLTSLEEAQRLEADFYHPQRGWLRRGVKGERNPEPLRPQF